MMNSLCHFVWECRYVSDFDDIWFKHSSSSSLGRLIIFSDEHWRSDGCIIAISSCVDVGWHSCHDDIFVYPLPDLIIFMFSKPAKHMEVETKRCLPHLGHFALGLRRQDYFSTPTTDFEG